MSPRKPPTYIKKRPGCSTWACATCYNLEDPTLVNIYIAQCGGVSGGLLSTMFGAHRIKCGLWFIYQVYGLRELCMDANAILERFCMDTFVM